MYTFEVKDDIIFNITTIQGVIIKMKTFGGSVLFLDRSDINTDEIIEAKYLEELPKQELETYLFQNLKI